MNEIASFLNRHKNDIIERVDLLPYHKLGVGKYAALDCTYQLEGSGTPGDEVMADFKQIFIKRGFNTLVEYL